MDHRMVGNVVAIGVSHRDLVYVSRVAANSDAIALGPVEIEDDIVPEAIDPKVVVLFVLPGDAMPMDHSGTHPMMGFRHGMFG